jgi:hypothetical protein
LSDTKPMSGTELAILDGLSPELRGGDDRAGRDPARRRVRRVDEDR